MLKRSALLQLRWAVLLKYWHLYSERKKDRQNAIRGDKKEREKRQNVTGRGNIKDGTLLEETRRKQKTDSTLLEETGKGENKDRTL